MKKILAVVLLTFASLAQAHGYGYGYHYHSSGHWVGPALIGGIIGYQMAQPRTVIVQQPAPVIVQQQPQVAVPSVPYGYHYENIMDANCGCYRVVLVPN